MSRSGVQRGKQHPQKQGEQQRKMGRELKCIYHLLCSKYFVGRFTFYDPHLIDETGSQTDHEVCSPQNIPPIITELTFEHKCP